MFRAKGKRGRRGKRGNRKISVHKFARRYPNDHIDEDNTTTTTTTTKLRHVVGSLLNGEWVEGREGIEVKGKHTHTFEGSLHDVT